MASLDTGRTLFEENAGKLMQPASNMKLYTVAAALDRLAPDYRFKTSVYAPARPDATGTVRGDLIVYGRGDPTFAARFNDGDYYKAIDDLAARIAAAGVKRVEGDLVGDESYFTGAPLGFGWEWDDLTWYSGAEVSALSVNDNALDLFVKPGARVGAPCTITTGPPDAARHDHQSHDDRPARHAQGVDRLSRLGENVIEVGGQSAARRSGLDGERRRLAPRARLRLHAARVACRARRDRSPARSRTVDARERNSSAAASVFARRDCERAIAALEHDRGA